MDGAHLGMGEQTVYETAGINWSSRGNTQYGINFLLRTLWLHQVTLNRVITQLGFYFWNGLETSNQLGS